MSIRTHILATFSALSLAIGPVLTPAPLQVQTPVVKAQTQQPAGQEGAVTAQGLPPVVERPTREQAPQIEAALDAATMLAPEGPVATAEPPDAPLAACGGGVIVNVAGGTITSNTLWTAGHVYVISANITLQAGTTLTVQKGAVVKVGTGKWIDIYGTLDLSTGSGSAPIFTSYYDDEMCDSNLDGATTQPDAVLNGWDALYLESGSALAGSGVVRYSYSGLNLYNLTGVALSPTISGWVFERNISGLTLSIQNAGDVSPTISNNTFTLNRDGLVVDSLFASTATGSARPTISSNTFNNQGRFPIFLGQTAFPTYSSNTFTGSGFRGIGLSGYWAQSGTLASVPGSNDTGGSNYPYVVYERWLGDTSPTQGGRFAVTCNSCNPTYMTITPSASVTVPNNTVIKLAGHLYQVVGQPTRWVPYYIYARGDLLLGTGVVFTSFWDDYGGDTNHDSGTTTAIPGDWDAIYLETTASAVSGATVRYGDTGINVWANGTSISPSVANSTFQYNKNGGLYLTALGSGHITSAVNGNTFTGQVGGSYAGLGELASDNGSVVSPTVTSNVFTGGFTSTVYLETYNGYAAGTFSNNAMRNSYNGVELWLGAKLISGRAYSGDGDIGGTFIGNTIEGNHIGFRTYGTYFTDANTIYSWALGSARPSLQNNTFRNNSEYPIELAGGGFPTYSGNSFENSGIKAINMYGFWFDDLGGTWPAVNGTSDNGNLPYVYRVDGIVRVETGGAVSFAPGSIIKVSDYMLFKSDTLLTLSGASAGAPTVITSWSDDSVRGDTNGDGAATTPSKGSWYGFFLTGDKPALTQYVDIRYGVFGLQYEEYFSPDPTCPAVANSAFTNNVYGFVALAWNAPAQNSCMTVRDSTFNSNTVGIALSIFGSGDLISAISNNTLTNNTYGFATSQRDWEIPTGTTSWIQMVGNGLYRPNQIAMEILTPASKIGVASGSSLPTLSGNTFTGGQFPMYYGGTTFPTLTGNVFSGMAHRAIRLGGHYRDTEQGFTLGRVPLATGSSQALAYALTTDPTPCTIPWRGGQAECISQHWIIDQLSPVSLAAGAAVKIDAGLYIDVFGELYSQGTSLDPVVFTSYLDDSVNGDTNGAAGTPTRGTWQGLYLESSGIRADYAFENTVVKYSDEGVVIYNDSVANNNIFPIIRANTFAENNTALTLTPRRGGNIIDRVENNGSTTPLVQNNVFRNNNRHILATAPVSSGHVAASFRSNCLLQTVTTGVANPSASNVLDASSNWWSAPGGPNAAVPILGTVTTGSPLATAPNFCSGQTYSVSGRVYLYGDTPAVPLPLANAVVTIDGGLSTTTNASGFYAINGVAGGDQVVRPFAPGYRFTPSSRTIPVAGAATGIEFEATAVVGQTFSITGRVVDEKGAGISGIIVTAADLAGLGYGSSATTDGSGNFTLLSLPAGQYRVSVASLAGYSTDTRTVGPNQTGVVLSPNANRFVYIPLVRK